MALKVPDPPLSDGSPIVQDVRLAPTWPGWSVTRTWP